jgi:hypothetical protein
LLDGQGGCNIDLFHATFIPIDVEAVLKIKPSRHGLEDVLAWQPERSGIFTVKSAYKLAFNELPAQCEFGSSSVTPLGEDPCWSKIWKSSVQPKVKTFAWKVASNALATESNKRRRNMKVTGLCNICSLEMEDTMHALVRCPHAHRLWNVMRDCWHIPSEADFRISSLKWFRELLLRIPDQMIDCTLLIE